MIKIILNVFVINLVFFGNSGEAVSLDFIFEQWLRAHKNLTYGTDESFYAQSPILSEYDFIVGDIVCQNQVWLPLKKKDMMIISNVIPRVIPDRVYHLNVTISLPLEIKLGQYRRGNTKTMLPEGSFVPCQQYDGVGVPDYYPKKLEEKLRFENGIGSGPGGAAVANRLSEIPSWSVLLVEAGKEPTIILDVPMLVSVGALSSYNWGFKAERETGACRGLADGRCRWPRGKCLGGTSTINYMIYTRGNKEDFDSWYENGNYGWSFKDVWPYFLKSENNLIPFLQNSQQHSRGGPVTVDVPPFKTKLGDAFLQAGQELGYNIIDYNNGTPPIGFAPVQGNIKNGRRVSAERAYLRPAKHRRNLHVTLKTRATKILIHPETKKAYGVEMVKNGRTHIVYARKEVVLCAGSLQSPQLLMLSGVGPREHLEKFNIPVIQHLPGVGQNLQEHVTYSGLTFLVNETHSGISPGGIFSINNFIDFLERGKGLLTLPGGVEALAYINTKYNDDVRGRPDIELIFASGSFSTDDGLLLRKGIGVTDEIYQRTYKPVEHRDSWTVWPMILHPKSKGYIKLKSKDPFKAPKFVANYFQYQQDLDTIVEGIKFAVELSKTKSFQKYGSYLNTIPLAGCENYIPNSDNYWRCAVRTLTTTLHHQSGTCKMGPQSDPMAVVDPELRVYGIKNLRVVDASIIPQLVTAHTTAAVYMIGEKGSDMIKQTWSDHRY